MSTEKAIKIPVERYNELRKLSIKIRDQILEGPAQLTIRQLVNELIDIEDEYLDANP
jgi:hypothetical protein